MFPWNKQYPFNQQKLPDFFKKMNPNQVENYVQQVMGQVFGQDQAAGFPYQFAENHEEKQKSVPSESWYEATDRLYFKIPIPAEQAKNVKIQHNSHQLTLVNFPETGEKKSFQMPFLVRRKGTKATYQNEELELSFLKNEDLNVTEIHIPEEEIRS
ncbi:spore gernimation protein GerT [Bacillus sp. FJAT-42376]|uniref:spore gernimation protein GerT n=1 Tax=Bacillus sp. FJAT-42376 TaxID=2014076 RepID=UPI000F4E1CDF|nr:spore gernimation protein GerT [Bacillus sp. FJAT-42376]AZB43186.1 spore gernimation protein GerT [Bacillus sp. FJAT-42376]